MIRIGKRTAVTLAAMCCLTAGAGVLGAKTIHVSTSGSSGEDGSSFASGCDFKTALGKVSAGDSILVQGGTHKIANNKSSANTFSIIIAGTSSKWIYIVAESGKRATFDFQWAENSRYLNAPVDLRSYGFYFETTAKYLYFDRIDITRAGYQGAYVTGSYITFENCVFYKNWNSGLEINNGGAYVTAINCDAYGNYDGKYKNGGMADGFATKEKQGAGNKLIGCRAWDNSDDGYDCFDSPETVIFENCWAFKNGFDQGNGNGFKVGGYKKEIPPKVSTPKVAHIKLINCVSFGHKGKGFDQNNNAGGITAFNCTGYDNGTNWGFGNEDIMKTGEQHTLKNNIAIDGKLDIKNATQSNNSWNSGFSSGFSDFESLDLNLASIERNIDGTIPETKLFRLKKGSALIDAGVDVGISGVVGKPDLGAFEYVGTTGIVSASTNANNMRMFTQLFQNNQLLISFNGVSNSANVNVYSLNGMKVLGAAVNNNREISIDCSAVASGRYVTELDVNGVKQQIGFTK